MIKTISAITTLLTASGLAAQTPAFDPRAWEPSVAGPRTQVLVVGSVHLSGIKGFDPKLMSAVIDKLAAYKPTIVTIESLSGKQCDEMKRYPTLYPGVARQYCRSTEAAKAATGLDQATAVALAEQMLATWPATPTPASRRRLISILLAADEPASALVQWLRLPEDERREGDGLDEALVKLIGEVAARPNENYQVAAVLAARCGLERVYPIDDHTADATQPQDPNYDAAIGTIWASGPNRSAQAGRALPYATAADMLASYRFYNAPGNLRDAIGSDFGRAVADKTAGHPGRTYVGWWEVRNLRMVSNIRAAFTGHPGARVLSVVGSSHKPYFDAYLDMMHEVQLIDAEGVLK